LVVDWTVIGVPFPRGIACRLFEVVEEIDPVSGIEPLQRKDPLRRRSGENRGETMPFRVREEWGGGPAFSA
jgi:hypothetical protein